MAGKKNSRNKCKQGGNSKKENSKRTSNNDRCSGNSRKENSKKMSNNDRIQDKRGNNSGSNSALSISSRKETNGSDLSAENHLHTDGSATTSIERKLVFEKSCNNALQPRIVNDLKYSSWQTPNEENSDEEDKDNTVPEATHGILKRSPNLLECKRHNWQLFEKSLRLYHRYIALENEAVSKETSSPTSTSDDSDDCVDRTSSLRVKSKSSKRKHKYHPRKNKDAAPPNKYQSLSIFPSQEDIKDELPFIRSNVVEGEYKNCGHYLDVQFRLFREDYIKPLRDCIEEYKQTIEQCKEMFFGNYEIADVKKRLKLSHIYEDVKIVSPEHQNTLGLIQTLSFKPLPPSFIWKSNSRLQEGTLLCLSSDGFVDCFIFATVVMRDNDEVKKGNIKVCFEEWKHDILYDFVGTKQFTMLEPRSAYFESYRHTLSVLKTFDEGNFPLQKYIVKAEKKVDKPCYLNDETLYDFSPILKKENYPNEEIPSCLQEVHILDDEKWPSQKELGLDFTQFCVLKAALRREFCIIQGPPGTGKTFIGLKIVNMLLHNSRTWYPENIEHKCPILIVCYTNHALDQFLERILKFTEAVVRIGDQSESELLADYTLKNLRSRISSEKFGFSAFARKRRLQEKQDKIKDQINTYNFVMEAASHIIFKPEILKKYMRKDHYRSLLSKCSDNKEILMEKWLEVSDSSAEVSLNKTQYRTYKLDSNDTGMNIDEICSWVKWERDYMKQKSYGWNKCNDDKYREVIDEKIRSLDMMDMDEATNITDVWNLPVQDKWRLYCCWIAKFIASVVNCVKGLQHEFVGLAKQIKEASWEKDLAIIQNADIIGMTCTGAAKNHYLVEAISPKIVIVEEAAEVLEPHLIASLPKSTKHLILIGDHQQLRPLPSTYELAVQCKFDVSLFERMVRNEIEYWTLVSQHRMRPQIAELLKGTIYAELSSHENVYQYEDILGIETNLYFFAHISVESKSDNTASTYCNLFEAKMVARLAGYFLLQNYDPSKITILATYSGQVKMIKNESRKIVEENKNFTCTLADIKVTTVDNYQGEENDIIIVSFVRSNYERKIGFLKHPNRACVALSRARKGLYCFGNFKFLASESDLWQRIVDKLNQQDAIGSSLALICQNHSFKTDIECSSDFKKVFDGGCAKVCGMTMQCGHICKRLCHVADLEHNQYKCEEKCTKHCQSGHPCKKKCYEDCGKCTEMRFTRLPKCGHRVPVPCYIVDLSEYKCEESCDKMLPCRHVCTKMCYQDCTPCMKKIPKTLPCGHTVMTSCGIPYVTCTEPCRKTLICGHPCSKKCGELCEQKCKRDVAIQLPCGHITTIPCEKHATEIKCQMPCSTILPCGHKCPGDCEKCCQGTKHVECWLPCDKSLDGRAMCKLRCGHKNRCSATFPTKGITMNIGKALKSGCSPKHPLFDRHKVNKWKTGYNEDY